MSSSMGEIDEGNCIVIPDDDEISVVELDDRYDDIGQFWIRDPDGNYVEVEHSMAPKSTRGPVGSGCDIDNCHQQKLQSMLKNLSAIAKDGIRASSRTQRELSHV